MEKQKINFKPLHEGMGFHPFSDGLPYAPESKTKYQNGTGATSAGRPQFATSTSVITPQVRNTIKTARQLQEQKSVSVSPSTTAPINPYQTRQASSVLNKATASVTPALQPNVLSQSDLIRRRAFAYLMDTVIHAGFWLLTNLTALFFFKFQFDSEIVRDNFSQFLLFFIFSQWMFIALQEVLFGNSLGKVFFNLEFKRNHRSLFLRSLVFMIGVLAFGTGLYFRPQDQLGEIQLKLKHPLAS